MNEAGVYEVAREYSGRGYCPYDPRHNSTFMFTGKMLLIICFSVTITQLAFFDMLGNFIHVSEGDLYSGTVSDFSGSDALIIRDQIRTEQYNLKHLNNPDFVGSVEDEDYVYFFFREDAVENMNCAKVSD